MKKLLNKTTLHTLLYILGLSLNVTPCYAGVFQARNESNKMPIYVEAWGAIDYHFDDGPVPMGKNWQGGWDDRCYKTIVAKSSLASSPGQASVDIDLGDQCKNFEIVVNYIPALYTPNRSDEKPQLIAGTGMITLKVRAGDKWYNGSGYLTNPPLQ